MKNRELKERAIEKARKKHEELQDQRKRELMQKNNKFEKQVENKKREEEDRKRMIQGESKMREKKRKEILHKVSYHSLSLQII